MLKKKLWLTVNSKKPTREIPGIYFMLIKIAIIYFTLKSIEMKR